MRNSTNLAILLALMLFLPLRTAHSQALPSLKNATEVTTGVLPNGIAYYLVTNAADKGKADFAIVQKAADDPLSVRSSLVDLPHFEGKRPYRFLSHSGVGYRSYGFVESDASSTRYRFERVPVSSQAASDTTLMMVFDISERSPYAQAVVVSGDINPAVLVERMKVLSMIVSRRQTVQKTDIPPHSQASSQMRVEKVGMPAEGVSELTLSFSSPRAPRELMNTVQPLVTEMFAKQLGSIGRNRIKKLFRERNIPLADVDFSYRSSADGPCDERLTVTLHTSSTRIQDALQTLCEVFSSLKSGDTGMGEYVRARDEFLSSVANTSSRRSSNRDWVDRCISSYLYGASLSSTATRAEFFEQQKLPVDKILPLFNAFVSALISPLENVTLRYSAPSFLLTEEDAGAIFRAAWTAAADVNPSSGTHKRQNSGSEESSRTAASGSMTEDYGDTTRLALPKSKVKLKKELSEPISGGKMWTFSNGMRVIYKKMNTKGRFDYALLVKGGYNGVPGIAYGECAFVQDMLGLCDISGFSSVQFMNMLGANAVVQHTSVSLSDLRIHGSAPSDKLLLVLKSLLALSDERKVNQDAFAYYKDCEALRLSLNRGWEEGIEAVLDSIMCPGYIYSPVKRMQYLKDDLPSRAASYYDRQFSRVSDGVLVLIGDLNEETAKKYLLRTLGGFQTGAQHTARPNVSYSLRPGWSSCTVSSADAGAGGPQAGINIALSALLPYSGERYFAFKIAQSIVEREIVMDMADAGMYMELSDSYEFFPMERLNLRINCRPADESGLPSGITPEFALKALGSVRSALQNLSSAVFSEADLKLSKAALTEKVSAEYALPSSVMSNVLMRYSEGKDLVTGYKDKINAVSLTDVREILRLMEDSSKVEYVVY